MPKSESFTLKTPLHFSKGAIQFLARPIIPEDHPYFEEGYSALSDRTKTLRFFNYPNKLIPSQLKYLSDIDQDNHIAWGILDVTNDKVKPAAVGRMIKIKSNPKMAEIAITVVDEYQNLGLGKFLFSALNIEAFHHEIEILRSHILRENISALRNLKSLGYLHKEIEGNTVILDIEVLKANKILETYPEFNAFLNPM